VETRVLCFYHECDLEVVPAAITKRGGYVCAVISVPFWNVYGEKVSIQYAVVYQSKEPIDVAVKT
jgi:hypothetical protein